MSKQKPYLQKNKDKITSNFSEIMQIIREWNKIIERKKKNTPVIPVPCKITLEKKREIKAFSEKLKFEKLSGYQHCMQC